MEVCRNEHRHIETASTKNMTKKRYDWATIEKVKGRKWHKKSKTIYKLIDFFQSSWREMESIQRNSIEIHSIVVVCAFHVSDRLEQQLPWSSVMWKRWWNVSDCDGNDKCSSDDKIIGAIGHTLSIDVEAAWIHRLEAIDNRLNNFYLVIIT